MALIVVLFIDDEQTGDTVENSVYTFIGSGCSGPSFLFFELGMIIGGKEAGSVQFLDEEVLDCGDVLFELELHAAEGGTVVAEKKGEPYFWHSQLIFVVGYKLDNDL